MVLISHAMFQSPMEIIINKKFTGLYPMPKREKRRKERVSKRVSKKVSKGICKKIPRKAKRKKRKTCEDWLLQKALSRK